ncbi:MAG: sulfurtransferase TusA family protein [Candidatus Caldarchaeum sp.]|uniref:Sulfurtransferase TusA family protein n=1 Tax=Caldiarchaeum subterraneum TaxID=311458 RepID=A0A7C5L8C1_CALS0
MTPGLRLEKTSQKRYVLDVRGYTCPYPQILLAKALKQVERDAVLEVLTDNPPSLDTLPRSIRNSRQEYLGTENVAPGLWKITAKKVTD